MIEDFTIDGKKNAAFPKLPMKRNLFEQQNVVNTKASYDYFGVYHKKFLYYLSNNVDAFVIRHEIDKGSKSHIEIPGSKIPNSHYSGILFQITQHNSPVHLLDLKACPFVVDLISSSLAFINHRKCARSEVWQLFLDFRRIQV